MIVCPKTVEKSIEYIKPAYPCFVDLRKAFDRIQFQNIIDILYNRGISTNLIRTVESSYSKKQTQIKTKY